MSMQSYICTLIFKKAQRDGYQAVNIQFIVVVGVFFAFVFCVCFCFCFCFCFFVFYEYSLFLNVVLEERLWHIIALSLKLDRIILRQGSSIFIFCSTSYLTSKAMHILNEMRQSSSLRLQNHQGFFSPQTPVFPFSTSAR